jgi:SAM-dependent methyltransferase
MKSLFKQILPSSWRSRLREAQRDAAHSALPLRRITDFGQLRRLVPVSRDFGLSRGQPIDRYYIEQFLAAHAADIRGRVLEVQSDTYMRQFGGDQITRSDVVDVNRGNARATIVADLGAGDSLPSAVFDCILCTQTLLLIYDFRSAISNMHQALKPGCVLLATVPGVAHKVASEEPSGDFWRFTSASVRRVFAEIFGEHAVKVQSFGNVLSATAFLYGLAMEELESEELDRRDPEFEVTIAVRAVKQ